MATPTRARPGRGRHRKGRHSAPSGSALTTAPGRWPLKLGVGITLVASMSVTVATAGGPGGGAGDLPGAAVALTGPSAGAVESARDRDGAASRSQERAPRGTADAAVTVPQEATLPGGESTPVEVAAPPVLPGCDGEATGAGVNGYLPDDELCDLWDGYPPIRADAAVALARLNQAYTERFGEALCLTDGYRSYEQQVTAKAQKPTLTATPGTSNHGWGLAVDICADGYAGERFDWLKANGPQYGWDNPQWAQAGGSGPYEPWHWEFTAA